MGLNNGAIGTVVSAILRERVKPPVFPEAVIVDFQRYKGPVWSKDHPTWIPIIVNSVMCDRISIDTGIYAITITKSQGMTIGENQQITKAIIKLSYNINMEKYVMELRTLRRLSVS